MIGYQLAVVFVGCHHEDIETLFLRLLGDGAYHVVRFETGDFQDRDIVCFYNILNNRYGLADHFRCFFALCLVQFVGLMTESRPFGVESHGNMRRIFTF